MKRALILLAGALVVLIVAVFAVPALIDWNDYKPEIEERLARSLDREVEIAGDLSLSVLPTPEIAAEGVRLGAGQERDIDLESVGTLRLRVDFLPLLLGRIDVQELVLVEPVVLVRTGGEAEPAPAPRQEPASAGPAAAPPAEGRQTEFTVQRLLVRNGRILVRSGDETTAELGAVDAELIAERGLGPFRANGGFTWRDARFGFEAATGDLAQPQAPVSLALRLPDNAFDGKLSGQLLRDNGAWSLRGRLSLAGGDLRQVLHGLAAVENVPPALGYGLDGQVAATPALLSLDGMTLRLGETQGNGAASLALADHPRAEIKLAVSSLDLDRWLQPAATAGSATAPAPSPTPSNQGDSRPAPAAPAAADGFSLPGNIEVAADLSADALVYRGSLVRQARLAATLAKGRIEVRQASALLPGGAGVSAAGSIEAQAGKPAFDGAFEASADNLRATLQWLGVAVETVPADRLRLFSATGKVAGTPDQIYLRDLDLGLDTSRIAGAVTLRPGPRPAFGANLAADTINFDAYLPPQPQASPQARPAQEQPPASPPAAAPPQAPGWAGLLTRFDANIKARIDQMTLNAVTVNEVVVDGTVQNGDVTLRQASIGEFGGTSGRISGVVAGLGRGELAVRDLAYELRSRQPEAALRLFGIELPLASEKLGSLALTGTIDGDADGLRIDTRAETAGGVATVKGTIADPLAEPRYRFAAEASHSSFADVVRLFSPEYRPAGRLGGFAMAMTVDGDRKAMEFGDLRAQLGPVNVAGGGRLQLGERPRLTGSFTAGAVTLDDFLPAERSAAVEPPAAAPLRPAAFAVEADPGDRAAVRRAQAGGEAWSREPLGLGWLRSFDAALAVNGEAITYKKFLVERPTVEVTLGQGLLTLQRLVGALFGGDFVMSGTLSADGAVSAALDVKDAHVREALLSAGGIDMTGGVMSATARLATQGRSSLEMVSRLEGEGSLSARDGVIRGINLGDVSQRLHNIDDIGDILGLLEAGRRGSTRFSSLNGTFKANSGIVTTDDLVLHAEGGTASAVATANLPRYTIDGRAVFRLTDHPQAPSFVMLLQGPLDDPRRKFDTRELQTWAATRGLGRLMERSERAGKVGEALNKVVPGLVPTPEGEQAPPPKPAEQLLRGLIEQLR